MTYRYLIRLVGGRYDGQEVVASKKPPERVVVRPSLLAPVLVWFGESEVEPYDFDEGGEVYARVSDSKLPDDFEHPHVLPGGRYEKVAV